MEKSIDQSTEKTTKKIPNKLFSNIFYLYRKIWRADKKYLLHIFVRAFADMMIPLLSSAIVAVIIAMIGNMEEWKNYASSLAIVMGSTVLCLCLSQLLKEYAQAMGNYFRSTKMMELGEKLLYRDYERVENAANQKLFSKAWVATSNPAGAFQKGFEVLYQFLKNTSGLILYGVYIGNVRPVLLIVMVTASVVMYKFSLGTNRVEQANKEILAPLDKRTEYLVSNTGNFKAAKDMRLYHMEEWFTNEFEENNQQRLKLKNTLNLRKLNGSILSSTFGLARDGLAYWILIGQVMDGTLSVASFSFYFGIVASLSSFMDGILTDLADFSYLSSEVDDFRTYIEMDEESENDKASGSTGEFSGAIEIEFKHVYYRYDGADSDTVSNLNWHIHPGEKVGMVGINGAGKSTIIKLLCGLYQPTKGEILINGIPTTQFSKEDYFKLFSVVFQDYYELPVTIEETIKQGNSVQPLSYDAVLKESGMDLEIEKFSQKDQTSLVKRVNENAIDLSGGQKQKLQLARAIYKNAPILILDEPTAALDPIAENELYMKYNNIAQDKTSIFISHRLSSTRFCTRIVYLEDGTILEEGNHDELMQQKGKYFDMYSIQSQYYQNKKEEDEHE